MSEIVLTFRELVVLLVLASFLTAIPAAPMVELGLAVASRRLGLDFDHHLDVSLRSQDGPDQSGDAGGPAGGADSGDD